jgi:hypothetical protein
MPAVGKTRRMGQGHRRIGPAVTNFEIFIDDSGVPERDLFVHSALCVPVELKALCADLWRAYRLTLATEFGIPHDYELHATKLVGGRGRPGGTNPTKADRLRILQRGLEVIDGLPGVRIATVYVEGRERRKAGREESFGGLLRLLDQDLTASGTTGSLVIDGDGSNLTYGAVHHRLAPETMPDTPVLLPADQSHWLQAADLIAFTACQEIGRLPTRTQLWGWYTRYLPKAVGPVQA